MGIGSDHRNHYLLNRISVGTFAKQFILLLLLLLLLLYYLLAQNPNTSTQEMFILRDLIHFVVVQTFPTCVIQLE